MTLFCHDGEHNTWPWNCPAARNKFTNRHCIKPHTPLSHRVAPGHKVTLPEDHDVANGYSFAACSVPQLRKLASHCANIERRPRSTTDSRDRLHRQESRVPFTTDLRIVGRSDAGRGRSAATRGSFAGRSSSASAAISSTLGKESACSAVSGVLRGSVSSITRYHDICKHRSTVHVANKPSKLYSMSKLTWAGAMWRRDGTQR